MNILLVEPRTPETFWSLRHALRFVGKRAANPPLGLLTMAGLLPRDWSCRLVDRNTSDLPDTDLAWADFVMVSAMEIHRGEVTELARRCRAQGRPLIGGGPLFMPEPDASLGVPHVVVGEAEEIAAELVADLRAGTLRPLYQAPRFPDLSLTPLPEQEQPRVAAEVQRHPSGVEVTQTGWKVTVDGKFAGMVDCLTGGFKAYTPGRHGVPHGSLDAAVSYIVAQHRTPSPERSIERVRDDAEEDSRREAEAVSA